MKSCCNTDKNSLQVFLLTTAEPAYSRAEGSDTFCLLQKKFPTKEVAFFKGIMTKYNSTRENNNRRTNGMNGVKIGDSK